MMSMFAGAVLVSILLQFAEGAALWWLIND